jgi:hypothetical protein
MCASKSTDAIKNMNHQKQKAREGVYCRPAIGDWLNHLARLSEKFMVVETVPAMAQYSDR